MVVHLVDQANAEGMNLCSGPYPPDVNELELAGFKTLCRMRAATAHRACPVHFECVLEQIQPFGKVPYKLVIARVLRMHFRSDIVNTAYHVTFPRAGRHRPHYGTGHVHAADRQLPAQVAAVRLNHTVSSSPFVFHSQPAN
jgi:flavin reductase (DIM6/NTAB) family NADH-FMN oxidoreductase RutF